MRCTCARALPLPRPAAAAGSFFFSVSAGWIEESPPHPPAVVFLRSPPSLLAQERGDFLRAGFPVFGPPPAQRRPGRISPANATAATAPVQRRPRRHGSSVPTEAAAPSDQTRAFESQLGLGAASLSVRPRGHRSGRADPSSTDGDGPGSTINLVSLNITSLQANWPTITALGTDYNAAIVALQETRHAHTTRQAIATNAASPLHGGYKASLGPDIQCARVTRKAAHGGTDHSVTGTSGDTGGVAILAKDAIVDSTRDDPATCVSRLKATKRWHEVFQPLCTQRR